MGHEMIPDTIEESLEGTVASLLLPLRRVSAALTKDHGDIGLVSDFDGISHVVVTSGPHLMCSTPLDFSLPFSAVLRGKALLTTLSTYDAQDLDIPLEMTREAIRVSTDFAEYVRIRIDGKQRYRGRFACLPPLAHDETRAALEQGRLLDEKGLTYTTTREALVFALERAILCANLGRPNLAKPEFDLVHFRAEHGRLLLAGVDNAAVSRSDLAPTPAQALSFAIPLKPAITLLQGIQSQVLDPDHPEVTITHHDRTLRVRLGKVSFILRCQASSLPNLDGLLGPAPHQWSVSLPHAARRRVLETAASLIGGSPGSGVRFLQDQGTTYLAVLNSASVDASIDLPEATMTGQMPLSEGIGLNILRIALTEPDKDAVIMLSGTPHAMQYRVGIEGRSDAMALAPIKF